MITLLLNSMSMLSWLIRISFASVTCYSIFDVKKNALKKSHLTNLCAWCCSELPNKKTNHAVWKSFWCIFLLPSLEMNMVEIYTHVRWLRSTHYRECKMLVTSLSSTTLQFHGDKQVFTQDGKNVHKHGDWRT